MPFLSIIFIVFAPKAAKFEQDELTTDWSNRNVIFFVHIRLDFMFFQFRKLSCSILSDSLIYPLIFIIINVFYLKSSRVDYNQN